MSSYRFFISYQHEDIKLAEEIESLLRNFGHDPYRDMSGNIPGEGITPQVKEAIAMAHILLIVITNDSVWKSAWVQQEIGYALACNIPGSP